MSFDVFELNISEFVGLLLFMSSCRWRYAILLHESGAACWVDNIVVVLYVVACVLLHVGEGVIVVWCVDVGVCYNDGFDVGWSHL